MKYLLVAINSKYIHSNLAVYSLKSYAKKYGTNQNEIEIAEYTINQYPDEILQDIYEKQADAIGFSCYIWNISMVLQIIEDLKKVNPHIDVWVGGPEVSYHAKDFLRKNEKVDFVIFGEGEEAFRQITDAYAGTKMKESTLSTMNGIVYRKKEQVEDGTLKEQIIQNEPCRPLDLSEVPFVYDNIEEFENKIIYYESSRGCPFSCSYCLSSIEKMLQFRNMELVKKELEFLLEHKVAQVKFIDRTFNCNPGRAMEIWKFIKEHDNGVTNFHFEIAADLMTDAEIELINGMRPGLIQLEIGVQSTNEETLREIRRKTDIQKIAQVVQKIRKQENVHQHLDLIAGLPYEGYDSFAKSFDEVYKMKPDQLQLGFLKLLKGSYMEKMAEEYQITYSERPPYEVLKTHWLSYEELIRLKCIESVVDIYYNSFQYENTLNYLESVFDSPFQLYEQLGGYYKRHCTTGEKHARITRYLILLGFCREIVGKQHNEEKTYEELLTLDFYLRENAKTRPIFAKDDSSWKPVLNQCYRSKWIREVLPDYDEYSSRQIEKMTHIEVFGMEKEKQTYILFDYKNRNPLNKQAKIIDITEMIREEK